MKKIAISACMMITTIVAYAQPPEWIQIDDGKGATSYYIDPHSAKVNGNFRTVWVLLSYKAKQPGIAASNMKPYYSAVSQNNFDCENKRFTLKQVVYYSNPMGKGPVSGSQEISYPQPRDAVPGSAADLMIDSACMIGTIPPAASQ
ncbi:MULTISPECIES: surface-adhesin E family protein [Burkholderia]|uniref:surface-adhesin E family protein n=1 Tax=Burkholderia TaxID=32008 RepID=UPI001B9CBD0C|nr:MULTISPECIES: surface-adhesin E family protein [Burkholderia]MBR8157105.1 hypothetical protein [Burkholderia cenocepacia]MCA8239875.1 hypothetical protein [Burkholderia sp. AU32262]